MSPRQIASNPYNFIHAYDPLRPACFPAVFPYRAPLFFESAPEKWYA
ncbi:MAG TPA: hypothetical protein PLV87_00895 [Opitutaceae bacterium]|nr:hypothetical protein [Opitutaceae bacterium]